jgi:hypothetical protein
VRTCSVGRPAEIHWQAPFAPEEHPLGRFALEGVTTLRKNSNQARARAEAFFKKKEEPLRERPDVMAECEADRHAVRQNTARLRSLRLARDAANNRTPALRAKKRSTSGA